MQNADSTETCDATFVIQKHVCSNYTPKILLKYFYCAFYKNVRKGYFLNCCSLVYSANYIKLVQTDAFSLFIEFYQT